MDATVTARPIIDTRDGDDFTHALVRFVDDAQDRATDTLREVIGGAVRRHLVRPGAGDGLLNDTETAALARTFAGPLAVCDLLGRARIRQALADVLAGNVDVDTFDESLSPYSPEELLKLVTPEGALDYFRRLIPIRVGDDLFGSLITGQAFTIAATTSTTVRRAVAKVIENRIETGKDVRGAGRAIEEILVDAGITPRRGYGSLVWRTNTMEAYRRGSWKEFEDPDVATMFPVWQYSGIPDGRERMGPLPEKPDHHRWFGKFFARAVTFWGVRGNDIRNVANCRCNFIGVNKFRWRKLESQGARLTPAPAPSDH